MARGLRVGIPGGPAGVPDRAAAPDAGRPGHRSPARPARRLPAARADRLSAVFRQVVAHRWAPQADATDRDGFRTAMESLRAVPELVALRHGDDAGHFVGNHDYVAVLDFPDFAA